MNNEEKYNQALERARIEYKNEQSKGNIWVCENLSTIFPELRESEDERIRKELLEHCLNRRDGKQICVDASDYRRWAAWLEKQGEKSVDESEPKFKAEDWITNGSLLVGQVTSFDGEYYHYMCEGIEQPLHISNAYNWHLWTIQDAKDGDVLFTTCDNINEMVFIYYGIEFDAAHCYFLYSKANDECKTFNSVCSVKADIHPATIEQRDLLFQKMKDAGYEWNAEKKELKKIEQKTAWSEENEKMCQETIDWFEKKCFPYALENENPARESIKWLKSLKDIVQSQPKQEWSKDDKEMIRHICCYLNEYGNWLSDKNEEKSKSIYKACDWLKSINPKHWKPSKEQMSMLLAILNDSNNITAESVHIALKSLYNDLKKL